jgi:hypothetical protein
MPDLSFEVRSVEPVLYAASPAIAFTLAIRDSAAAERIESIALRAQVRIETKLRPYDARAEAHLVELFGPRELWNTSQRSLLWAQPFTTVHAFSGETTAELHVPCTYDFEVATAKYFHALEHGGVPLLFLFSGTAFYRDASGALQIAQIPWSQEASFRMPVQVWQDTMRHYFPNTAWLRLSRDVFDRLYLYKAQNTFPTWEAALESLLQQEVAVPR